MLTDCWLSSQWKEIQMEKSLTTLLKSGIDHLTSTWCFLTNNIHDDGNFLQITNRNLWSDIPSTLMHNFDRSLKILKSLIEQQSIQYAMMSNNIEYVVYQFFSDGYSLRIHPNWFRLPNNEMVDKDKIRTGRNKLADSFECFQLPPPHWLIGFISDIEWHEYKLMNSISYWNKRKNLTRFPLIYIHCWFVVNIIDKPLISPPHIRRDTGREWNHPRLKRFWFWIYFW